MKFESFFRLLSHYMSQDSQTSRCNFFLKISIDEKITTNYTQFSDEVHSEVGLGEV